MKYYKIIYGYGVEEFIQIDETELEKAYYCFLKKKDSIFSGGAVRGSNIQAIQPDYHRAMGWNRGYKLGPDDFAQLSDEGVSRKHLDLLEDVKGKVNYLLSSGQEHLIGKNIPLEIPKEEAIQISKEAESLAKKFKV